MDLFALLGYIVVCLISVKLAWSVVCMIRLYILPRLGFRLKLTKLGKWAVITGSTDGIGKAYAKQLASRGLNVFLISRNINKLQDVKQEIQSAHKNIEVKVLAIDFTGPLSIYQTIASEIGNLDIAVLVNNVGLSYDYPEYYLDVSEEKIRNLCNVNIVSVNSMIRIVLPNMVAKGKGAIVNLASMSASWPVPFLTIYGSSKTYVDHTSLGLSYEYEKKGIIIQSVLPAFVCSNMSKVKRPSLFIPSADTYTKSALNTLGLARKTHGYWPHELQATFYGLLPRFILVKFMTNTLLSFRAKALQRKAKSQ